MMLLSFDNIILLKEKRGRREPSPRQVDNNSGVPRGGERVLGLLKQRWWSGILKEEEMTNIFFFSTFLSHIKRFFL